MTPYLEKLSRFYAASLENEVPFRPVEQLHLADGVTIVRDDGWEFDVYFDSSEWEATDPRSNFTAPFPTEHGLGVISHAEARYIEDRGIVTLFVMASGVMRDLKSKNGRQWYQEPIAA